MTTYRQQPPYAIQVELTEGCNLFCNFCGLQGIRPGPNRDLKFMTPELAARLASLIAESGWRSRIEFAMHGEPTMNPNWLEIIGQFRRALPRQNLMMLSNGGGLLGGDVEAKIATALKSLNVLAVDAYESVGIARKIQGSLDRTSWRWYPDDGEANPHRRRKPSEPHELVFVRDISQSTKGNHATLNNHAGSAFALNDRAAGKRCAKGFRELSIRWDGQVAICCNDWRGQYRVGAVADAPSLEDIWQHPAFDAARHKLIRGERDFGPCHGCDALSYRPGLLPDTSGKHKLGPVTDQHRDAIATALAGPPMAAPVPRLYEIEKGAS